ncbi:MAG: DUF4214 domain-containing protein, partial [Pseudomonadota bacterium]
MAITTQMRTDVSQLYVALFGRAPDGEGLGYWVSQLDAGKSIVDIANAMYGTAPARTYYPSYLTNQEIVGNFYTNVLGRTADAEGLAYWTDKLNAAGATPGSVIAEIIGVVANYTGTDPAGLKSAALFQNKVQVAQWYGEQNGNIAGATSILSGVTEDPATVEAAKTGGVQSGQTFTLTNGTDVATANVFNAPMVFVPDGSDRILSLQDEDVLTGIAGRTDNTLNVTMGNINADEGTTATTTPVLNNIQNINIDWTGNTNTLDLRNADATQAVNVKRVTSDATAVTVDNIGTPAADFRVANTASDDVAVTFRFKQGVLTGDETLSLQLDDVLAASVTQDARGAGAGIEGFETVNLNAINGVDLGSLSVNEMESLVITGSGALKIAALTPTSVVTTAEYDDLGWPGIANPGAVGLLDLDASAFEGDLTLDITNSLGGFADPANSGQTVHGVVTGGLGDDAFWSSVGVASTSATNSDTIDGGAGNNRLILVDGDISGDANISNIQTLELRNQSVATDVHNVDFDAFDAALTSVVMRDEDSDASAGTFNLNDVGAALAADGLVLQHSVTEGAVLASNATVRVRLADASGTNDTVAIRVENERNTETQFNYTLNFDGQAAGVNAIENVTINDNDTETNVVTLTSAAEHKGTVTLTGGVAGQSYTVASTLVAKTVDAAAQKSNLVLTVGKEDQAIKLGAGNDRLTFDGLDTFNGSDAITDIGGTDTVRAAFSKDVTGTPELAGIENLHIVATANSTLDLAKGTDLTQLVLMSNEAVDENNEVFSAGIPLGQVNLTDVITLKNTKLSEVNFFGDEDAVVAGTTVRTAQNFNGLTLENNTGDTVAVKIGAPLQNLTNLAGNGITNYNLGQLTTHGVKDLSIVVSNEIANNGATTTIANIWDRDLVNLTLSATGNVNVGTVTGNTVNSNVKTFNASAVGGNTTATVKALGDSAIVTLAAGNDVFNALGSAGNNVVIQAGEGNNTITGTAQSDYIYSGAGRDVIDANRGNNTVKSGAGDDTVSALNGSNTVDLGAGNVDKATFNYDTAAQLNLATNVIAG